MVRTRLSADDLAFNSLCELLRKPPRQRTLTDYIDIGTLIYSLCPADGPNRDSRGPAYGARWVEDLIKKLRDNGITLSDSMVYRYRRLATLGKAFHRRCRAARGPGGRTSCASCP